MIFPTGFPTLLTPDISLSAALAATFGEAQANFPSANISRLAISIVALDEIPFQVTFKHAGLRDRKVHYSAGDISQPKSNGWTFAYNEATFDRIIRC